MSKKCTFCNAEMADDAVQCPECEKYVRGYENAKRMKKEKSTETKKSLIITICAVAFVLLLFFTVDAVMSVVRKNNEEADGDYAKVLDKYIEAVINCDYNEYLSLYPDFYKNEIDEMYSYISGSGQEYLEKIKEDMVSQFGYINEITYTINSESVASDSQIEDYQAEWNELYGFSERADVSAIYIIDADFKVSGRNSSFDKNQSVMLAKIDGKWYLMNIIYFLDTSNVQ